MGENLPYQSPPPRALGQFVELAPHAAFAQEEKLILGQVRPWNAENALGAFANLARIDQTIADGPRKSGFDKSHSSFRFLETEVNGA
jgi:hypothetical protein